MAFHLYFARGSVRVRQTVVTAVGPWRASLLSCAVFSYCFVNQINKYMYK